MDGEDSYGALADMTCCSGCGYFRHIVHLEFQQLHEAINIELAFDEANRRSIGGASQTVAWYIKQQGLDLVFGRSDHASSDKTRDCACSTKVGRKRRASITAGQRNKIPRRIN
jgi:hypothetical protein